MLGKQLIQAAAGSAAAGGGLYVDDVFSTFLYDGVGNGSTGTQVIQNGIDLSGEGGLTWIKCRGNVAQFHQLFDTERGVYKYLRSGANWQQVNAPTTLTNFNSNGFTLSGDGAVNESGRTYVSWTFRKAPGFFDVVTYTGNGTAGRTVSHNLGSVPGSIWVKNLTDAENWVCYHRGLAGTYKDAHERFIQLNQSGAAFPSDTSGSTAAGTWGGTAPDADNFYLGGSPNENASGKNYVAYLFAHDEQIFGEGGDQSVIQCGYSTSGTFNNLGWEPQWVLVKSSNNTDNWYIYDNMRGLPVSGTTPYLNPNLTSTEATGTNNIVISSTGFTQNVTSGIWIAIRRPHKPPTAGTDVFAAATQTGKSGNQGAFRSGFVVDMAIRLSSINAASLRFLSSRMTAPKYMLTNSTAAEDTDSDNKYDFMDGWNNETISSTSKFSWMFKRAPGFFDVVAYSGGGSTTKNHNLAAVPELMIVKVRNANGQWYGYSSATGTGKYLLLSSTAAAATGVTWGVASSTFTVFGGANDSNETYVSYLFATLSGISKVGSYAGTGNAINVDCGFSSGARFILIKRTDATGDWYVYDSARGIVSGNDPYLLLNSTAAEVTNTDYIDPLSSGFTVTSSAPTGLNASGGTYIFLAIA